MLPHHIRPGFGRFTAFLFTITLETLLERAYLQPAGKKEQLCGQRKSLVGIQQVFLYVNGYITSIKGNISLRYSAKDQAKHRSAAGFLRQNDLGHTSPPAEELCLPAQVTQCLYIGLDKSLC